jgi:GNAT superfamily N-acetyltransferase
MSLTFRNGLLDKDNNILENILKATGFFNQNEIDIALELINDGIIKQDKSSYRFLLVQQTQELDSVIGYCCFGQIQGTLSSFDIYWIVVAPGFQNQKIGRQLLKETEKVVVNLGGNKLYAETSSRLQYKSTHRFYLNNGFILVAKLDDYYAAGDDKLIFLKNLSV